MSSRTIPKETILPGAAEMEDRIASIVSRAQEYLGTDPAVEREIRRAFEFARDAHSGQKRMTGEDYVFHSIAVADLLMEYHPDLPSIQTAFLHDVYEDTKTPLSEIERSFGKEVATMVQGMTKLGTIKYRGEERTIENLRKMLLAISKDIRLLFIKFCDRLDNLKSLHVHKEEKRRRIALETLNIHAPIAARLNMYKMRDALQEQCFKYLYPVEYAEIMQQLDQRSTERQRSISYAQAELMTLLKDHGIQAHISGRVKSPYTIFTKMRDKHRESIDDIYDVFALRVVVSDVPTCYAALGIIHQTYSPLSHRFKDYIGMPKPNGYQSIHTGVIGLGRGIRTLPTEIQIRTEKMDEAAEYGMAAHAAYKERDAGKNPYNTQRLTENEMVLFKNLARIGKERSGREEFWAELQRELFSESIFVFTPKGDVKELPIGSTPLDFAYSVHTDIGHRFRAAKVNGSIVQLNHELSNGDVVEIVTQKESNPSQYWLSLVRTGGARSKIKNYFLQQNREEMVKVGRELLNRQLERLGEPPLDQDLTLLKSYDDRVLSVEERENLLSNVGNGSLAASGVLRRVPTLHFAREKEKTMPVKTGRQATGKVLISGETDLPYRLASCCTPASGQRIIGFVTRGGGISVHAHNCKVVRNLDPQRFISAKWSNDQKSSDQPLLQLKVLVRDRIGVLKDMLEVLYRVRVNIVGMTSKEVGQGKYLNTVDVEHPAGGDPLEVLDQLISNLEALDFVQNVEGRVLK